MNSNQAFEWCLAEWSGRVCLGSGLSRKHGACIGADTGEFRAISGIAPRIGVAWREYFGSGLEGVRKWGLVCEWSSMSGLWGGEATRGDVSSLAKEARS